MLIKKMSYQLQPSITALTACNVTPQSITTGNGLDMDWSILLNLHNLHFPFTTFHCLSETFRLSETLGRRELSTSQEASPAKCAALHHSVQLSTSPEASPAKISSTSLKFVSHDIIFLVPRPGNLYYT